MSIDDFLAYLSTTSASIVTVIAAIAVALYIFQYEKMRDLYTRIGDLNLDISYLWSYGFSAAKLERHIRMHHLLTLQEVRQQLPKGGADMDDRLRIFEATIKSRFEEHSMFQQEMEQITTGSIPQIGTRQKVAILRNEVKYTVLFQRIRKMMTAMDSTAEDIRSRMKSNSIVSYAFAASLIFMVLLVVVPLMLIDVDPGLPTGRILPSYGEIVKWLAFAFLILYVLTIGIFSATFLRQKKVITSLGILCTSLEYKVRKNRFWIAFCNNS